LDQKKFFNALVVLKTNLNPTQTLKRLLRIERKFKRKREFKNSPRTLDLDIIFFDNISVNKKDLIIPHSDFKNRDSVLIPLSLLKGRM
jgi:2-amino-4-hydroxy-6-hydroxymethyldihydropteridine diphosphokinase